ncbi:acyl-CoA Delta(11) desaturase-like [Pectinophora gossypiella]|uniref:acyl-CoA Delta(11) desaturase-like n=1 Tax=Pectinophora gossypiella TaxID=13191 RepID=UPI00214DF6F0|nr:acyl-CoA Delta(11) desaturase-like [Pectinophora gossypiella]
MAPNVKEDNIESLEDDKFEKLVAPQASPWKFELLHPVVLYVFSIHVASVYGLYVSWSSVKWATVAFTLAYYVTSVQGITAGAHRLWSHKSYKAKLPLQILYMIAQSATMQYSIIWWASKHRQHHKFSDTDGDPHNATRHIFFSHIGWIMTRPHPEAVKRRKLVDVSDLKSNSVLAFQRRHMVLLNLLLAFLLPIIIPVYLWSENIYTAWHFNIFRVTITYHCIFFVNSIAHKWGMRPYDKKMQATQAPFVAHFSFGEGWHNFHHVFPWDYSSDELGSKFSFTTKVIDFFAKIGWAYDLKSVPKEVIYDRAHRTGDGSPVMKSVS